MSPSPAPTKQAEASSKTAVAINRTTHRLLLKSAKELGLTNGDYACAAISYFAERGLNPVSDRQREGMVIQAKIAANQAATEKMITTLGNRLFEWLTQHESNLNADLFSFLRRHEETLFDYLQAQDMNMHERLADQEEMFLTPMLQELFHTQTEALYGRRLGEQLFLRDIRRYPFTSEEAKKIFQEEYTDRHLRFSKRLQEDAQEKFKNFVEKLSPTPQPLPSKPQPTPLPQRSKAAPVPAPEAATEEPEIRF